jgi:hypothetical protein
VEGVVQGLSASLDPQDHRVAEILASRRPSRQSTREPTIGYDRFGI